MPSKYIADFQERDGSFFVFIFLEKPWNFLCVWSFNPKSVISLSFFYLWPIWSNPEAECMVCKTYVFIKSNLLSYKNWKQKWKTSNTAPILLLWVRVLFVPKKCWFFAKNTGFSKIKGFVGLKDIFSETICVWIYESNFKFLL